MITSFDNNVKRAIKAKTTPEPWLHCGIVTKPKINGRITTRGYAWAVYVWDTREVIESGWIEHEKMDMENLSRVLKGVIDNHQKLVGINDENAQHVSNNLSRTLLG